MEDEDPTLNVVQLDGLVVLKIMKHCKENLPDLVTGQLLGLDVASTLEVTNCFPYPSKGADEEDDAAESTTLGGAEYQIEMMRCLREVNVDNNTVGWYSSTYMGSFINESSIETQFNYQEKINKKCVMLVYDPLKTAQGILSLKAYRLTLAFMELYKSGSFTKDSISKAGVTYNDIFEEIPIKIHNSSLITAFLTELEEREQGKGETDFDKLDLSTNPFLERNLEFLIECLDDLGVEQNKFQYHQRSVQRQQAQQAAWLQKRRAENATRKQNGEEILPETDPSNPIFKPIQEPGRLESLLITNQISNYCKQINHFAGNSFTKIFLVGELHKEQP
jgi:translation initiation factor 3 subunit H